MSLEAITWVLETVRGLKPTDRLVLFVLANYADPETNECWPKVDTIAQRCDLHRETARIALRRLEEAGLVSSDPRYARGGRQTSSMYTLLRGEVPAALGGGAPATAGGGRSLSDGGVIPLNPQKEPSEGNRVERGKAELAGFDVPESLDDPETLEALGDWLEYRHKTGKGVYKTSRWIQRIEGWGPERARAAIAFSMAQEYMGIFEEGSRKNGAPPITLAESDYEAGSSWDPKESTPGG